MKEDGSRSPGPFLFVVILLDCAAMLDKSYKETTVTAALIVIGNEVLSGRTREANIQSLGEGLNEIGIRLMEARVIADDENAIGTAVNACRAAYDYVFTTGGIGPTHDDITAASIAKAFGLGFGRNLEAEALLCQYYRPEDVTEARLTMADMPEGVELIDNPVSKAPGFRVENVYVLPGVPRIMLAMFDALKHGLVGGLPVRSNAIITYLPEGQLAGGLGEIQARQVDVEIGSYPFSRDGKSGTSLVVRHTDQAQVEAASEEVRELIRSLGGDPNEDTKN